MEYKTTTKLKQSTLWRRLKLMMTHNFTEYKAETKLNKTVIEPNT